MSKRAEAICVALGFASLALAVTYPLVFSLGERLPSDLGDPLLTAWTLAWDADRIRHGLRGIWDAPNFFPYTHTLLYSDHLLGIALFTAPIQWATRNPLLAYNAAFVASVALSGIGAYLLARELTGRRDAAVVAGVVFACQPFRVSHLSHLQWLVTGWLPLGLWALHRYFATRAPRYLTTSTACYLMQSLTAAYFTYFALLPYGIVAVVELWRSRMPMTLVARHLTPAAVLAALVLVPVARAYYETRTSTGLRRSAEDIVGQSADLGDYFSATPRLRIWGGLGSGRGEHELFPGAAALALAAAALVTCRRQPAVATYALVLAAAVALSLGPWPSAWSHRIGVPGPYALLLRVVPGLDGLRAPARLAVVAQVALAVLAAFGAVWLLDRVSARVRQLVLASIVLLVVAEGWAAPIDTLAFEPNGEGADREAYAYLRTLPSGAVMELPTTVEDPGPEFVYQFMTLAHRHRTVNGHSGYVTPLLNWLGGGHSPLREADRQSDALAALRGLGVRYLVVHRRLYSDPSLADAMLRTIEAERGQIVASRSFGDATLAVLTPLELPVAPSDAAAVAPSNIRVSSSDSADRLPLLFDADSDTRWISGGPQSGDEWLELTFDRPRDVRVLRMQTASRSFGDYPRELSIEANEDSADSGTRPLFHGSVLPQFARGLVASPDYPWIEIVLPPNRARTLRLRQLGSARTFFWSIHELAVYERL